jgi:hypothetical protein
VWSGCGVELLAPGLTRASDWLPEGVDDPAGPPAPGGDDPRAGAWILTAVGRKTA